MFLLIAFLFLVVPLVELYVIIQVAQSIGGLETVGLLIVDSLVGAWLVRREGMSVLRKVQEQLGQGNMPTKQLVDGALILFAGALMLTPGFVTDGLGVLLLIPPTRVIVRNTLMKRFKSRVQVVSPFSAGRFGRSASAFDVDSTETSASPDFVDLQRNDDPLDPPPPSLPQ